MIKGTAFVSFLGQVTGRYIEDKIGGVNVRIATRNPQPINCYFFLGLWPLAVVIYFVITTIVQVRKVDSGQRPSLIIHLRVPKLVSIMPGPYQSFRP